MKTLDALEKSKTFWSLISISFLFFILRFPSLFEPNWYGDEGIYQTIGNALRQGLFLYRDIWDNKPPLLYIFYGAFSSDQFVIRLISLIFGLLSVWVFYKLSKKLFKNGQTSILATLVFAIIYGLPILEGNIANAENFMLLPILLAALIILNLKKGPSKFFLAGAFLGLAFLFKIVAFFDFLAFLLFIAFFTKTKKEILPFTSGFFLPILGTSIIFIIKGAGVDFLNAVVFSNIGYVGYANKFLIPQGLLVLKLAVLAFFIFFLFLKRKNLGLPATFILLWFSASLFNALFSHRPYTHYLLVLLPSFVLLLGIIFENSKYRTFILGTLVFSILIISKTFGVYGKVLPYYLNFVTFVGGEKSVANYQGFFDRKTPVDYEIAAFIKGASKKEDNVFIWGNNAQVYELTKKLPPGRFTVAYHITGTKNGITETSKDIELKKPKIVVIMPYMKFYPFVLTNYSLRRNIEGALIYERIL